MIKEYSPPSHCQYCHREFKKYRCVRNNKYYPRRNKALGLLVCGTCNKRYLNHGDFSHKVPRYTPEERIERKKEHNSRCNKYGRERSALKRERSNYLRTISPEELIRIVTESENKEREDMMPL